MDRVLELQELDLSIDRLAARREAIEVGAEGTAARSLRDEAQGRLGELRLALDSVNREASRLESDADSLTRKAEAEDRLSEILGSSAVELKEIEAALVSRRSEREALGPELDEELLELYEDLRRQKKGIGAAALQDGVCQGCHQKLSALELERLKRTEGIRRCEYCRRILVFA